jgi:hypothetical protein
MIVQMVCSYVSFIPQSSDHYNPVLVTAFLFTVLHIIRCHGQVVPTKNTIHYLGSMLQKYGGPRKNRR